MGENTVPQPLKSKNQANAGWQTLRHAKLLATAVSTPPEACPATHLVKPMTTGGKLRSTSLGVPPMPPLSTHLVLASCLTGCASAPELYERPDEIASSTEGAKQTLFQSKCPLQSALSPRCCKKKCSCILCRGCKTEILKSILCSGCKTWMPLPVAKDAS